MTPVDQSIFEDGKGNCLSACVASLLDLPLSEVPNFAEMDYFAGLESWLAERQIRSFTVRFAEPTHCSMAYFGYSPHLLLVWGGSPRCDASGKRKQHAAIGRGNGYGIEVVHDPHPSRDGLVNICGLMVLMSNTLPSGIPDAADNQWARSTFLHLPPSVQAP